MFCSNCGTQMPDEAKVCPVCGKVVDPVNPEQPTPAMPPQPPKKSKGALPFIAIIAAALVVSVLLLVACWDYISNGFAKTFMPAEDYYTYVEKSNVENAVSNFYDFFGFDDGKEIKNGFSGSLKVEIGEEMKEVYEIAGIGDQMDWLEAVEFEVSGNVMPTEVSDMKLSGKLNGVEIISGKMIMDMENGEIYGTVPDLMTKYFRAPLNMVTGNVALPEEGTEATPEANQAFDELKEMMEKIEDAIPSEKVASKLAVKYFELISGCIKEAEKGNEKLEIKDVTQSCTTVTIEIDGDFVIDAMEVVFTEAKSDKDIKKIIRDMAEAVEEDPDDVYETFRDGIEDLLDMLEDLDGDDIMSEDITLKNWVSASGEIVAREIEIAEVEILIASIENGNKVACEYSVEVEGTKAFEFSGSGKKTMTGLLSGKYSLEATEMEVVEIEVDDFDTKKFEKDGYINGKFYFAFGDDVMEEVLADAPDEVASIMENLRLGFDIKSDQKSFSFGIMLVNDKDPYVTLTLSAKKTDYKKPSIPSKDETVSAEDEITPEDIFNKDALDNFMSKLEEAGVPSDLLDAMQGGSNESEELPAPDYDW